MKQLWIIRHAKAEQEIPGSGDFGRKLRADRLDDIRLVATAAEKAGFLPPEWIVHSPSERTSATARLFSTYWQNKPTLFSEQSLYLADDVIIRQTIAALPEKVNRVALVGHNPGLTDFVQFFSPSQLIHLPTAGTVILEMKSWDDILFTGRAISKAEFIPKTLRH